MRFRIFQTLEEAIERMSRGRNAAFPFYLELVRHPGASEAIRYLTLLFRMCM